MKSRLFSGKLSAKVKFDRRGLVPAVVQEGWTGPVLMVAYMDRRALKLTLSTGFTHFYSRSRKAIWKKGEQSGHVQEVRGIRIDCDGDALLVSVSQKGPGACHTGHFTCFYREAGRGRWVARMRRKFDPKKVYR